MNDPVQRMWQVFSPSHFSWRLWAGEFVVHHMLSNDTHRLAKTPGELLVILLSSGPQSVVVLANHLVLDESTLEETLEQLAAMDLVVCR